MLETFLAKFKFLFSVQALGFCVLFCPNVLLAEKSSFFDLVKAFLPKDILLSDLIEVLPGTSHAEQIDSILLKVLTTNTGKIFCGAYDENYEKFEGTLFIGSAASRKGFELCKGHLSKASKNRVWKKHYYIGLTQRTDHLATGWTTPRNETILFINPKVDRPERLTYSLVHEIAVSLDRKENIGFGGEINFSRAGLVNSMSSCLAAAINRKAEFKHLLTALRAFEIERHVGADLGMEIPLYLKSLSTLSCTDKIISLEPAVRPFLPAMQTEKIFNALFDTSSCSDLVNALSTVDSVARVLAGITLNFEDQTQRNACEYFTEGLPFLPGAGFRGGPGPRIGGGW